MDYHCCCCQSIPFEKERTTTQRTTNNEEEEEEEESEKEERRKERKKEKRTHVDRSSRDKGITMGERAIPHGSVLRYFEDCHSDETRLLRAFYLL